jgi:hypothetical protein
MATTTPNFGWPVPTSTDLVKDGATAIEGLGDAIDASLLDLKGGTTNQVLAKNSNTDMDFKWVSDATGMTNPMTTTGDTIYSSSGSTPARLGIGSTGQVLTVAGGVPSWATPASGSSFSGCALTRTTTLSTANSTIVQIGFDNEVFDVDGYHDNSSNNERLTVPSGKSGYFLWTMKATWDTNASGLRVLIAYLNGARYLEDAGGEATTSSSGYAYASSSYVLYLNAGDYVSTAAFQTSGGSLNVLKSSIFQSLVRLGS